MCNNFIENEFYCTQCGNKGIPIQRKRGQEREAGHLKKIYCLKCGIQTNHVEVKPYTKYTFDDFKTEFEYANFDENGQRKITYGQLKELINNGKINKTRSYNDGRGAR